MNIIIITKLFSRYTININIIIYHHSFRRMLFNYVGYDDEFVRSDGFNAFGISTFNNTMYYVIMYSCNYLKNHNDVYPITSKLARVKSKYGFFYDMSYERDAHSNPERITHDIQGTKSP